ncbi:MAG: hypothetical protein WCB46_01755 [Methanoregula sp.]
MSDLKCPALQLSGPAVYRYLPRSLPAYMHCPKKLAIAVNEPTELGRPAKTLPPTFGGVSIRIVRADLPRM